MSRWSYMHIYIDTSPRSIKISGDQSMVENICQSLLPGYKKKSEYGVVYVDVNPFDESLVLEAQILDYLGNQGWEAYSHDGNTYFFKRQMCS